MFNFWELKVVLKFNVYIYHLFVNISFYIEMTNNKSVEVFKKCSEKFLPRKNS